MRAILPAVAAISCLVLAPGCGTPAQSTSDAAAAPGPDAACVPENDLTFCDRLGQACGTASGVDNCGEAREATCASCSTGQSCVLGACKLTVCVNGVKDSTETDVDCGGAQCPKCLDGRACLAGVDCQSGQCEAAKCATVATACSNGVQDGNETDVDCGGRCPAKCALGERCLAPTDCASGYCSGTFCQPTASWDAGTGGPDGGAPRDGGNPAPDAGATQAKVMLAIDRSGSMKTLVSSDTQWGCANDATGTGYNPAGDCKWNSLKDLLVNSGGFLDQTAGTVRHGMAVFSDPDSAGDACAPGVVTVPVPAVVGGSVMEIRAKLNIYVPAGGTPSASALRAIASDTNFTRVEASTRNFVVFITDGQPNCNAAISYCAACTNGGDPTHNCGDARNCLDDAALVSAVTALRNKGVDTFVIGFGSAINNPDAKAVLDAAAEAGGQPQTGALTKFYLATSAAELQAVLDAIRGKL